MNVNLKRHQGVFLVLAIFFIAFIIRIIYINQLSHSYFFAPFQGGYDDYIFDNWAKEILRGNWFGDGIIYIYRMPLYVYFLSFIYFLLGHSYYIVYIIHAFVQAAAFVLVYCIGASFFNRAAGCIAAALCILYGPFLFYTGMLVGETLGIFTLCAGVLSLAMMQKTQKKYYLLLSGIFMGLAILLRGNVLIVAAFFLIWILIYLKKNAFSCILIFLAGITIAISPISIRNYMREKDIVLINASAGLNFYIGNAYGAEGRYRVVDKVSNNPEGMLRSSVDIANKDSAATLKPSQVSNYWFRRAIESIGEHGVLFIIPLVIKKFILFWNSYEIPDIWDYYFLRQYIASLRFPFVSFSLIASLAAAGMYLCWPRRNKVSILYFFIIGYMFSLIALFVNSRYRTQAVPFLSIFAGYAIAEIRNLFAANRLRAINAGIVFIIFFLFSNISIDKVPFATSHNSLGVLLKRHGKIGDAIKEYNKAIEIAPMYPSPYYNLGLLYRDIGKTGLAVQYFRKTLEIAPDFSLARRELEKLS